MLLDSSLRLNDKTYVICKGVMPRDKGEYKIRPYVSMRYLLTD